MVRKSRGFTLVELSLAMTFLSMLLLAIAMLIIQLVHIYDRGVTLRAVNQAGQMLVSDIRTSLNQANPDEVRFKSLDGGKAGRLCTGSVTYAWNQGNNLVSGKNKYDGTNDHNIRFVRVVDPTGQYCPLLPTAPLPDIKKNDATELLRSGDRDLAVHGFTFSGGSIAGGSTIYHSTLTLGTNDQAALNGTQCRAPNEADSNQDFCAINTFDFTARAGNTISGGGE